MNDKGTKFEEIDASHTLGGSVIHTVAYIRQSRGLRQTMPVWVVMTIHLLCTIISEEGDDGESTDSETSSLLAYTLRFVSLTDLDRLCQFGLR